MSEVPKSELEIARAVAEKVPLRVFQGNVIALPGSLSIQHDFVKNVGSDLEGALLEARMKNNAAKGRSSYDLPSEHWVVGMGIDATHPIRKETRQGTEFEWPNVVKGTYALYRYQQGKEPSIEERIKKLELEREEWDKPRRLFPSRS